MNEMKKKIFIVFDTSCAYFSNDIDLILNLKALCFLGGHIYIYYPTTTELLGQKEFKLQSHMKLI